MKFFKIDDIVKFNEKTNKRWANDPWTIKYHKDKIPKWAARRYKITGIELREYKYICYLTPFIVCAGDEANNEVYWMDDFLEKYELDSVAPKKDHNHPLTNIFK